MNNADVTSLYRRFKAEEDNFHQLMRRRVRNVLLVSTFYDAFIFEQDGRLSEQIWGEYQQLNLSTAPRVVSTPTGAQALERFDEEQFDLVVTMMRIGEVGPFELAESIKVKSPETPVLLLLNVDSDLAEAERRMPGGAIDDVFLWNGDTKLFLAMMKQVEDRMNVDRDTREGLVRVVLVVEDSVRYYSRFLPMLYEQIMQQTQRLIDSELSDIHKRLRMRARPKVLLAHTLEQALEWIDLYSENLIGVISDVSYPCHGEMREQAGVELLRRLREFPYDIPAVLQSSVQENSTLADPLKARFLWKHSHTILHDLRNIMRLDWGYGDFVFRTADGESLAMARDLGEFSQTLGMIPADSLVFHGSRNHFSGWLIAHGDIDLAREIRRMRIEDFPDEEDVRRYLLDAFQRVWSKQTSGRIINFDPARFNERGHIMRLADGTLGGKARGLAFLNAMFSVLDLEEVFPGLQVSAPPTAVIGAAEYENFIADIDTSSADVVEQIMTNELSDDLRQKLLVVAAQAEAPMAVRSSGLLEDSFAHVFAGVYCTKLLSLSCTVAGCSNLLEEAVKSIFASLWTDEARRRLHEFNRSPEEEKMAVVLQELSGVERDGCVAPVWTGCVRWNNHHGKGSCTLIEGLGLGFDATPDIAPVASPDGWPEALELLQAQVEAPLALALNVQSSITPVASTAVASELQAEIGHALAFIAQMMSDALRAPVEIEFAIPAAGRLDLLQVRPFREET